MNRILFFLQKKGPLVLPVVLSIIGILTAQLVLQGCQHFFPKVLTQFTNGFQQEAAIKTAGATELFWYFLFDRLKQLIIYWLLCVTVLGIPYYIISILKKSFQVSFLIGIFFIQYGSKGIFLGFCNYFPALLVVLPLYYICIKFGLSLISEVSSEQKISFQNKALWKRYGKYVFLTAFLSVISAALDAFFGPSILAWAIKAIEK